ncbi:hypothetical protein F5878DRAFT_306193 [Lentinula raphanica]|uniref:Uncharacterized protein n=1 Tax=Lentinula raphanica TaxID=153919 RepID=A0AA38P3A3_9AGAR|nr:hypothetical protein F5878DRAFT_306193 [Lentinula raphanica]
MPAFSDDRTGELLKTTQPTVARKPRETDDWSYFYVGIFVDRDMFMRYFPGGGVGHTSNRKFFTDAGGADSDSDHDDNEESRVPMVNDSQSQHLTETLEESDSGEDQSLQDDSDSNHDSEWEDVDDDNDGGIDWQWHDGYASL